MWNVIGSNTTLYRQKIEERQKELELIGYSKEEAQTVKRYQEFLLFLLKRIDSFPVSSQRFIKSAMAKKMSVKEVCRLINDTEEIANLLRFGELVFNQYDCEFAAEIENEHPTKKAAIIRKNLPKYKKELNLSNSHLFALPGEIRYFEFLTDLDLSGNNLLCLPKQVKCLSRLYQLNLSNNLFESFPEEFEFPRQLKFLNLHGNKLLSLPECIGKLTWLRDLDLSSNHISELPREKPKLFSLEQIDLRDNKLTSLPKWINEIWDLRTLDLSGNKLVGLPKDLGRFPRELSKLKTLIIADYVEVPIQLLERERKGNLTITRKEYEFDLFIGAD